MSEGHSNLSKWLAWLQLLAHLCAIATLIALLFQFRADNEANRAERALDYVSQIHSQPVSEYREVVENVLRPFRFDLVEINRAGGVRREELDAAIIFPAIQDYNAQFEERSAELAIIQLTHFYDHVVTCRDTGICDEEIIDIHLGAKMKEFWGNFETVIRDAREAGTTGLGEPLEKFAAGTQ